GYCNMDAPPYFIPSGLYPSRIQCCIADNSQLWRSSITADQ
ncbi:Aspartate carbamoyltransferase, partial [uncultured Leptolyngbya sp.]